MDETYSLMEFLQALASNTGLRDRFTHDPRAALHSCGLDHLSPADVHDALVLVEDTLTTDFSRGVAGAGGLHRPPPPADHDFATPAHDTTVGYLNSYVTNNYVDDHDTSAFGSGDTAADGAFASGGDAPVADSDHPRHDVGDPWTDHPVHVPFDDTGEHPSTDPFDDGGDTHVAPDDGQHHAGDVDLH